MLRAMVESSVWEGCRWIMKDGEGLLLLLLLLVLFLLTEVVDIWAGRGRKLLLVVECVTSEEAAETEVTNDPRDRVRSSCPRAVAAAAVDDDGAALARPCTSDCPTLSSLKDTPGPSPDPFRRISSADSRRW